ncbi:VOC family protein [Sphingomonas sp. G-3-2-10]|uniref:VOC family protein n=1 Tax=Sphingomonas sp. G-3-2-10 TaxID=2728838 RepID=UPI00146F9006|nr:VOC family protein [Sphingomonas sp. G-3-2-10]NML05846.1 hypothetical protein [Sphingomonas sp. G-3-2-10]
MRAPKLHQTMLRVADLDTAVRFYSDGFGMSVLEQGEGSVFVGFAGERSGAPIELVSDPDHDGGYSHGTAYGHVAVAVDDVPEVFARLTAMDAGVILPPGIVTSGGPVCAFVTDRDGYAVELVEGRTPASEDTGFDPKNVILGPRDGVRRILHTMLRISDVDAAIRFYVEGLGMTLLERIDIEAKGGVTALFVGYGADAGGRQLELSFYRAATEPYTHGTGFGHVAIGLPDPDALCARLDALGIDHEVTPAGLSVKDPDGHNFLISRG